jgi:hypothetical protein
VTYSHDVSNEGSLSFTRPTFASPDSPVWLGLLLGFSGSFARVVTEPHVPDGDGVEHYSGLSLTTPSKRPRVALDTSVVY